MLYLIVEKETDRAALFLKSNRLLAYTLGLVLIFHLIALLHSSQLEHGLREFIKLTSSLVILILMASFFPNDKVFLNRFLLAFCLGLLFLYLYLEFIYIVKFQQAPYLGTNIYERDRSGKNTISWLIAVGLPWILMHVWLQKKNLLYWAFSFIAILSLLHAASRGAWIAAILSILYILVRTGKRNPKEGVTLFLFIAVQVIAALFLLDVLVHNAHFISYRFSTVWKPFGIATPEMLATGDFPMEQHGFFTNRLTTLLNAGSLYTHHPIFGVGLGSTSTFLNTTAHNDYVTIFLETGILGGGLLIFLLILLAKKIYMTGSDAAQASFLALVTLSVFIDVYTSNHYWFFLAFSYVGIMGTKKPQIVTLPTT